MSFGGERLESAHNRGGEKKQGKKGSRYRAYHPAVFNHGQLVIPQGLGRQWGPPVGWILWGLSPSCHLPTAEAALKGHSSWGFPAVQSGPQCPDRTSPHKPKTGVLAARPRAERVVPKMRKVMRCADVSPSPCPDSQSLPGHQVCEHNFGIRIITQDPEMLCLLGPQHPP